MEANRRGVELSVLVRSEEVVVIFGEAVKRAEADNEEEVGLEEADRSSPETTDREVAVEKRERDMMMMMTTEVKSRFTISTRE